VTVFRCSGHLLCQFGFHYNYIFMFIKVMPETLSVPFSDTVYITTQSPLDDGHVTNSDFVSFDLDV